MRPRVVIAEDNFVIMAGSIIPALSADFEIVTTVGDGHAAIAAVEEHRPDVVLLDVSLPMLRGFEAARKIRSIQPACKVLFVSSYWDESYIEAAREIGAGGYVFKSRVQAELRKAILVALTGAFYRSAA